jgi:hypothetical protein
MAGGCGRVWQPKTSIFARVERRAQGAPSAPRRRALTPENMAMPTLDKPLSLDDDDVDAGELREKSSKASRHLARQRVVLAQPQERPVYAKLPPLPTSLDDWDEDGGRSVPPSSTDVELTSSRRRAEAPAPPKPKSALPSMQQPLEMDDDDDDDEFEMAPPPCAANQEHADDASESGDVGSDGAEDELESACLAAASAPVPDPSRQVSTEAWAVVHAGGVEICGDEHVLLVSGAPVSATVPKEVAAPATTRSPQSCGTGGGAADGGTGGGDGARACGESASESMYTASQLRKAVSEAVAQVEARARKQQERAVQRAIEARPRRAPTRHLPATLEHHSWCIVARASTCPAAHTPMHSRMHSVVSASRVGTPAASRRCMWRDACSVLSRRHVPTPLRCWVGATAFAAEAALCADCGTRVCARTGGGGAAAARA